MEWYLSVINVQIHYGNFDAGQYCSKDLQAMGRLSLLFNILSPCSHSSLFMLHVILIRDGKVLQQRRRRKTSTNNVKTNLFFLIQSLSYSLTNNQTEWLRTSHSHEHANNCSSAEREKVGGEQWKWKDSVSHLPPPILFIPFTLPQSGPVLLIFSLSCHVYVNYVVHAHTQIYI